MEKLSNSLPVCCVVLDNFSHKAGDGLATRKHHLKEIHPALQANPGSTQMTYVLECDVEEVSKCKFQINA